MKLKYTNYWFVPRYLVIELKGEEFYTKLMKEIIHFLINNYGDFKLILSMK